MAAANLIPCPASECDGGTVFVYNAYSPNPLKPEREYCALCHGKGFVHSGDIVAVAN